MMHQEGTPALAYSCAVIRRGISAAPAPRRHEQEVGEARGTLYDGEPQQMMAEYVYHVLSSSCEE
jgi:hypothetical protein